MRSLLICTADSYDMKGLYSDLSKKYNAVKGKDYIQIEDEGMIFYFSYGCIVTWGLKREQEKRVIQEAEPFQNEPLSEVVEDEFTYIMGDSNKIVNGEIVLATLTPLTLLAISHALAQSVKLDAFEKRVQYVVDTSKNIPEEMAKYGKVSLSRSEIRKKMGELFNDRNSINLHFDILDKPEFFWDNPEVEPLYNMTAQYLDIDNRVEVLNQRLGVIHELFEMLSAELNHQHSSRLEWIIIILIFIEIGVTIMQGTFHWF